MRAEIDDAAGAAVLRPPRPGDLGWVIAQHGALYAGEHGFDASFEVAVAEIVVALMRRFDPARDAGWIAEIGGVAVGSVFVAGQEDGTAKLRLLIVSPAARGRGVGRLLTRAAIGFARAQGYRRMLLWTMEMLAPARAIYAEAGFRLIASVPSVSFGCRVVDETWELMLDGADITASSPGPATD